MIAKLIELSQVCINGSNHTNNASAQAIYNQTGTFSSPNGHAGIGPDGSGPIQNDEEIICDILTEITSTLFKMYTRLIEQQEILSEQMSKDALTESAEIDNSVGA